MLDMILILNYSNEFSVEMAKRLRAEHVYAKIVGSNIKAEEVRKLAPKGIILSGEARGSDIELDEDILQLDIPVLAMGHPAQRLIACQGGACAELRFWRRKRQLNMKRANSLKGSWMVSVSSQRRIP